jgi:alpha-beta hydrolase superfamily lysophospholipase
VREGYAVYVVDQPGRGRSGYLAGAYGPSRNVMRSNSASRFVSQEKSKLWPQAQLLQSHTSPRLEPSTLSAEP